MVEAEVALARAQGRDLDAGVRIDARTIMREGRAVANPAEPLVRRLRELDPQSHEGATSQDIVDTAMMLVAKRSRDLIIVHADAIAATCAKLADEHRATAMAGAHPAPASGATTFGLKAAVWLSGVAEARRRLAAVELAAQLGGAAGTLASFGERGPEMVRRFAQELGLAEPPLPWHANRVRIAELVDALALLAGACGKIAFDVILLAQTEVAEVTVPTGGSTAMTHKRNPASRSTRPWARSPRPPRSRRADSPRRMRSCRRRRPGAPARRRAERCARGSHAAAAARRARELLRTPPPFPRRPRSPNKASVPQRRRAAPRAQPPRASAVPRPRPTAALESACCGGVARPSAVARCSSASFAHVAATAASMIVSGALRDERRRPCRRCPGSSPPRGTAGRARVGGGRSGWTGSATRPTLARDSAHVDAHACIEVSPLGTSEKTPASA